MLPVTLTRQLSLYDTVSERSITRQRNEMARLQEQLGSGLRVNRASDDPEAYSQARRMEVLQNRYAQYQRSIDTARGWVDGTQDALASALDTLTAIYEDGVRLASDTFSATDRAIGADTVEALLEELVDTFNTKMGDEYLFAGSASTSPPFTRSGSTVTYNGNSQDRDRSIAPSVSLAINQTGEAIQDTGQGYTVTQAAQAMIDALRADDTAQIQTALEQVTEARDHLGAKVSEAGQVANRLTLAEEQLRSLDFVAAGQRSLAEDADLAATILAFEEAQIGLQAALQSSASILQTTLLDFLR
ncbi:MAG: flagellar hook-associated protein FlgL [Bacteroidota bacterium]